MEDNIRTGLKTYRMEGCGFVSSDLGYGPVISCCTHGDKPSDYIKDETSLV
jgi:hypothetical protein